MSTERLNSSLKIGEKACGGIKSKKIDFFLVAGYFSIV